MQRIAVVIFLMCVAAPAGADSEQDRRDCANSIAPRAKRLTACTRLIDAPKTPPRVRALALVHRAQILMSQGKELEALVDLDRSIELDPGNPQAYAERGAALFVKDRPKEALPALEKALELDPRSGKYFYWPALTHVQLGQRDEALRAYDESIRLDPRRRGSYYGRARIYILLEKWDLVRKDAEAMIDLFRFDARGYHLRGAPHDMKGELLAAVHDYALANSLDPRLKGPTNSLKIIVPDTPVRPENEVPYRYVPPKVGLEVTYLNTERKTGRKNEMEEVIGGLRDWFQKTPLHVPHKERFVVRTVESVQDGVPVLKITRKLSGESVLPKGMKPGAYKSMWATKMPFMQGTVLDIDHEKTAFDALFPLKPGNVVEASAPIVFVCPDPITPFARFLGCKKPGQRVKMGSVTRKIKVGKWWRLTVPAGVFTTLVIRTDESFTVTIAGQTQKRESVMTHWFAPKVDYWVKRTRRSGENLTMDEAEHIK